MKQSRKLSRHLLNSSIAIHSLPTLQISLGIVALFEQIYDGERFLKVLSNGKGGGRNWYQSIHFDKLVCRQVFFFVPEGTPSREEHKTSGSVLTTFTGAFTNCPIGVEKSGKMCPCRSI